MHGADSSASQHGNGCFRHHRHINENAVTFRYTIVEHDGRQRHNLSEQFGIGKFACRICNRTIVDKRYLITTPICDMAVECIVAGVAFGSREPTTIDTFIACENLIPRLEPVDGLGCFGPKTFGVVLPCGIDFGIS